MKSALLVKKFRQAFLPTPQMREFERWTEDGGDEKFRFNYQHIGPDSLILDVGGYHGQWTSDMIARYGCHSIVIEPIPEFARFIEHRFRFNPRVIVREFALGDTNRTIALDRDSIYSTEFCKWPTTPVEMLDASAFFRQCLPSTIAAMSVNCEGGEYELLFRLLETGEIRKVKELEIQFHDFAPLAHEHRRQIRRLLMATHREVYCYPFVWEHWRRR